MIKREDWDSRLEAVLDDFRGRPFKLGKTDCGTFTTSVVDAITGHDFLPLIAGKYKSKASLVKFLRNSCEGIYAPWKFFVEHLAPTTGHKEIEVANASRGDICCANDCDVRPAMGVIVSDTHAAFLGDHGLEIIKRGRVYRAWAL